MENSMEFFEKISSEPFILLFGSVILLLVIIGLFTKSSKWSNFIPNIIVSIGILGTFFGIFQGLWYFDVDDIDKSIPELLGGLKLAFSTSLLGIFFSIVLRFKNNFRVEVTKEEISADDIHQRLVELVNSQEKISNNFNLEETNNKLTVLNDSIRGRDTNDESSLIGQIRNMRTEYRDSTIKLSEDINNGFSELVREFKEFSVTMAENSTKAIMEALENVIKDFNLKITEQFGENFKQLNEAVGKLLTWQEQYKTYLDQSKEIFDEISSRINESSQNLSNINEKLSSIPETMNGLQTIIETTNIQKENLNETLKAFEELKNNAANALPSIENNLNELTEGLKDKVNSTMNEIQLVMNSLGETSKTFVTSSENIHATLDKTILNLGESVTSVLKTNEENIAKATNDTKELFETYLTSLDQGLSNELSNAISVMGSHLAALSEKFVEDYTPLTERLREVVRISRGA